MLFHDTQRITIVIFALFVAAALTEPVRKRFPHNSDKRSLTDCDLILSVSLVCYQCSQRHEKDFLAVYNACCSDTDADVRSYCEEIYTEDPRHKI